MPRSLADAGLEEALGRRSAVSRTRIEFGPPEAVRGPSGLLAERALGVMVDGLSAAVSASHEEDLFPIVVGGDCAVLLGILAGFGSPPVGLIFVDGHEDAWPPLLSTTGEAADCELGLALGLSPLPATLPYDGPLVAFDQVAVVGPRDRAELDEHGVASLRNRVQFFSASELLDAGTAFVASRIVSTLAERWWLHVDLDVLSSEALPAVDYPQPGGLSWSQLHDFTASALGAGGCIGASVVIYNPDLDGSLAAPRIVDYIKGLAARALTTKV